VTAIPGPEAEAVSGQTTSASLHAVYTRNDTARRLVAGLMAAHPTLVEAWQQLDRALDDVALRG